MKETKVEIGVVGHARESTGQDKKLPRKHNVAWATLLEIRRKKLELKRTTWAMKETKV